MTLYPMTDDPLELFAAACQGLEAAHPNGFAYP